jgi:hypothetical protein
MFSEKLTVANLVNNLKRSNRALFDISSRHSQRGAGGNDKGKDRIRNAPVTQASECLKFPLGLRNYSDLARRG